MGKGIYIGSTSSFAGKSMLALGIGQRLMNENIEIAYMKPIALPREQEENAQNENSYFIEKTLNLSQNEQLSHPIHIDQDFRMRVFNGEKLDHLSKISAAYTELSKNKDLTIVSGSGSMLSNSYCDLNGFTIAKELGLRTVIVDRLHQEPHYDLLINYKDLLKDSLLGVVLNGVPRSFMTEVNDIIKPFLEKKGIPVLGVIPYDSLMSSLCTSTLAGHLGGRLITAQDRAHNMVAGFLIGTMQVENFASYFRKQSNSVVIVGGDRADVQLVAIEGNCPCLILTGNIYPNDIILSRAETLHIPIIMTRDDTYTTAKKMEKIIQQHKFHDIIKVHQGTQLVSSNLDFIALRNELAI